MLRGRFLCQFQPSEQLVGTGYSEQFADRCEKFPPFQNQRWIIPNLDDRPWVGPTPIFNALACRAVSAHDPEFLSYPSSQSVVIQSWAFHPSLGGTP